MEQWYGIVLVSGMGEPWVIQYEVLACAEFSLMYGSVLSKFNSDRKSSRSRSPGKSQ